MSSMIQRAVNSKLRRGKSISPSSLLENREFLIIHQRVSSFLSHSLLSPSKLQLENFSNSATSLRSSLESEETIARNVEFGNEKNLTSILSAWFPSNESSTYFPNDGPLSTYTSRIQPDLVNPRILINRNFLFSNGSILNQPSTFPFVTSFNHRYSSNASSSSSSIPSPSPRIIPSEGFLALNQIRDLDGQRKQKSRLGRGIGSGKGKTCGRGHKGQKARTGRKPRIGFEGGQTPLRLRLPKRGFHNPFSLNFQPVNVGDISKKIEAGIIDPTKLITMKTLRDVGLSGKKMKNGVKLLGRGGEKLKTSINIEVSRVSSEAKTAIEASGGTVTRVHYNKLGLRALLKPGWFTKKNRILPRPARPPPRLLKRIDAIGRLPVPITPLFLTLKSSQSSSNSLTA